jgi:hypothetical protein
MSSLYSGRSIRNHRVETRVGVRGSGERRAAAAYTLAAEGRRGPVDVKTFVYREEGVDALFPGWRRALSEPGYLEAINPFTHEAMRMPTWDPSPDEPFPPEAFGRLDDVPGELLDLTGLSLETLAMVFARSNDIDPARPLFIGPHGRALHRVAPPLLKNAAAISVPLAELAERIARFQMDLADATEHDEEMRLPANAYFDLSLEDIRSKTFRVEALKAEGYDSRASWLARFERWEKRLEHLSSIARRLEAGQGVFYVNWHDDP